MHDRLIVDGGPPDRAAVEKLLVDTIGQANRLYAAAHQKGWSGNEWQDPQLKRAFETTQATLGDEHCVTFQQIQKYEKGVNRIGPKRLLKIADGKRHSPSFAP